MADSRWYNNFFLVSSQKTDDKQLNSGEKPIKKEIDIIIVFKVAIKLVLH